MIFYSWGTDRTWVLTGPFIHCPNCGGQKRAWPVRYYEKYFRLYGITLLRWQRRFRFACPVCEYGVTFSDAADITPVIEKAKREFGEVVKSTPGETNA